MNLEKMISDFFEENHFYVEDIEAGTYLAKILIERGDWKHEHLRCNWLLEEMCKKNNLHLFIGGVKVTDEDGSDCYSAIHYYAITPN